MTRLQRWWDEQSRHRALAGAVASACHAQTIRALWAELGVAVVRCVRSQIVDSAAGASSLQPVRVQDVSDVRRAEPAHVAAHTLVHLCRSQICSLCCCCERLRSRTLLLRPTARGGGGGTARGGGCSVRYFAVACCCCRYAARSTRAKKAANEAQKSGSFRRCSKAQTIPPQHVRMDCSEGKFITLQSVVV